MYALIGVCMYSYHISIYLSVCLSVHLSTDEFVVLFAYLSEYVCLGLRASGNINPALR